MEYDLAESIQLVSATRSPSLPLLGNGSSSQAPEPASESALLANFYFALLRR